MINLKDKINKAATFRELNQIAENRYEQSWQPELQKDAFIDGAEALLKLLRIGDVSQPRELLIDFYSKQNGGMNDTNKHAIIREVDNYIESINCG